MPKRRVHGTLGRTLGMAAAPWFLYILRCRDGTLYTGIARDVDARLKQHETGRGARYTRGRGPLELCATRRCESHGEALRLEYAVKRLTREQKLLILRPRKLAAFARVMKSGTAAEPGV